MFIKLFKTYNPKWFKYRKGVISDDAWSGDSSTKETGRGNGLDAE
jgi:hypothetical protein